MPDANGNPTPEEQGVGDREPGQGTATPDPADHEPGQGTATPDPAAALAQAAALQQQLDQAQARNMELETQALRTANPDLPDAAFAGDDLAAIQAGVATARAVADHVRQQAEATRNGTAPPPPAPVPTGAGAAERQPVGPPAGTTGIDRIKFGLAQRS